VTDFGRIDLKNKISSHLFDDFLIVSLSKEWLNIFKTLPIFSVEFKNGRLILTSQNISLPEEDFRGGTYG